MHRIWSHRMQGDVPYESLLEADLVTILCVDPEVDGFWAQPEAFRWRQDGKVRRYVPDFLILTTAGARVPRGQAPASPSEGPFAGRQALGYRSGKRAARGDVRDMDREGDPAVTAP